jgi:3-deoxy-manno-octulosonate cytidylyltransferase (CMP-KDO synthetase)
MTTRIVAGIPARMGSSRFPGKPLATILGRTMIEHVYIRTAMSESVDMTFIATCDEEIKETVEKFGGNVIMTSPEHQRASDRIAEAVQGLSADIVVMVQGDEPMVVPGMLDAAVKPMLEDPSLQCVNLTKRITTLEEYRDPNTIKVVMDRKGDAIYFSREPIPTNHIQAFGKFPAFKQVCIIPFRRDFLLSYAGLEPTPLEQAESVDMMRILEHGYRVHMVETEVQSHAVDTAADLAMVEKLMAQDPLVARYAKGTG